jgi:antitoxin component YwqK of YwqJK toxin-antitoxin module
LELDEKNFAGETYLKSETIFADDYASLTSTKTINYKNVQFDVVSSGTYQEFFGYDFRFPNTKDSTSPQTRVLSWNYQYKIDSDVVLKVDNNPFTGTYRSSIDGRKFKVNATPKAISVATPSLSKDEKIYKKDIKRFKKSNVSSDFVKAYFPEYGGMDNVSLGIYSLFEFDRNIRGYNSNNYYLDTNLYEETGELSEMEYMDEMEYLDEMPSKRMKKNKQSRPVEMVGQYFNGKQEGLWSTNDQYGKSLLQYQFKNGELHGQLNLYNVEYPVKKRKSEEFEYDYMEDRLPVYLQDPKPKKKTYYLERTVNFTNGKIDGLLYHFNWKGDTLECEKYVDGIQQGLTFKRNKLFYTETMYEDGVQDGLTRTFLTEPGKDSVLLFELNFQNGALQGKSVAYHANGNIAKKGFFLNGLPIDDFEAFDTLGFRYQYVKFQYNQPIEEKIWEENQLSIKYEFDWRDSIPFNTEDITTATSIESLLYEMGFDDGSMRRPYYGRPSLVDKTGITYTLTKYYPNDTIARFGMIEKGKKVGCWEYFSYDGLKLMEVDYFDTLITRFDSIKFKSKGILTYVDSNGVELSKSYIIEKIEKYDCSHSDHHEERMLYCFWEKDTLQHRINGYVKNRYDNGALQNEGYVKDGMPVGIWKLYDSNGNLNQVGVYKNGKRDGRWIKGDLGSVKNMSEICLNPNLENLEAILNYEEKLLDISVIYYSVGKEIRREYYGINMNNEDAPEGYYGEEEYYEGEGEYYEEGY